MALIDNKITDGDISTYGVVSAPDRLTGTANENKQVFDNLIKQAVKVKMNELINDLIAATAAGELGAKAPSGLSGSNIQTVLQSLKTYVDNTKVEKVPGKELSSNDYTDEDKALVAQIPGKAGVDNVLTKDNTTPFEPMGEYNPCTKKYADNLAFQSGNVTSVFGRGGAVVAQDGDYTPQQVGAEPAFFVLPVSKGGTGQTTLAAARNAMGLGNTTGALPVANGGTGATSLANITVGNAEAIGGTPYTSVSIFNFFSRVDLFEKVKSMPNNSCGVYRNDGTCTGLPINGNGGTGYWIKTSEADAEILWLSLTGAKAHYRYLAGGTDSGWIDFDAPKWGGYKNWVGTQSEYNSIPKKDPNTLYFIVG